jgi:glycosyltransferase involved in cell wall biosynthesis
MNDKVSIIIPFYNTDKSYLKQAIESAICQTYTNIEIILVNDGSTINYSSLLKTYKNSIKVYETKNFGVSHARNVGIIKSQGKWITFLDSDDYLMPNSIEEMISIATQKSDVIITSVFVNNGGVNKPLFVDKDSKYVYNKQKILNSIFDYKYGYKCVDTPWAKLYKRKLLMENKILFNEKLSYGEDGIFNYEVYKRAKSIYISSKILYVYRVNKYSLCNKYSDDFDIRYSELLKEYIKIFNKFKVKDYNVLSVFSLRLFCRLIRKFYLRAQSFSNFKYKIKNLDFIFEEMMGKIEYNQLNFQRIIVLYLFRNKAYYLLFLLSKSNIKIK